jgi:hypothetical protein
MLLASLPTDTIWQLLSGNERMRAAKIVNHYHLKELSLLGTRSKSRMSTVLIMQENLV